jgi:hypothetical protein
MEEIVAFASAGLFPRFVFLGDIGVVCYLLMIRPSGIQTSGRDEILSGKDSIRMGTV